MRMADISKEIQNFRSARRGKDVRGSMISLAEKVNKESTDAKTAAAKSASDAGSAASNASYAVSQANVAAQNANTAAQNIQTKADRGDFTGTIQIGEVTTGEPGSEASANNSGTGKDAVIDLKIPRGYQGVSMRMAGAWADGTEYVNDTSYIDLVTYQGSTYGCKRTHTASEETVPIHEGNEYWQCIAEKGETGDIENIDTVPIAFEEAEERENIESGDSIPKGFGKIRKWFSDFKQAAYMNVVNGVTQSIEGQAVLDAAVGKYLDEKKLDISRIVANRNITEPNFVMDGKTAVDWFTELNGKLLIDDDCKVSVGSDENRVYLQAMKYNGKTLEKVLQLSYNSAKNKYVLNQLYSAGWDAERTIITTSDLGYVNCEVNTIANDSIAIPGAPNDARRIPIIIGHSSINNCLENISYINGWRIYSTVAQTTYIRFFKYPV